MGRIKVKKKPPKAANKKRGKIDTEAKREYKILEGILDGKNRLIDQNHALGVTRRRWLITSRCRR